MVIDSAIDFEDKSNDMYRSPSVEEDRRIDAKSEEDYDFCNADSGQNFMAKFTPPADARFCSRNKFISPRMSKTVPRRNRSMVHYRINRSLNFEIGYRGNDNFVSPKSNAKSPHENLHLSRSAKILKALNIDYSPSKSGCKKINKTLDFDSTPNHKRFPNTNQRRSTILDMNLESPGITKSLNFDNCEDSPVASAHETSTESMDENQNQTPSQPNKKVKKSLSYISLISNGSGSSLDFNLLSPARSELRYELREKIDDIVQSSMTPRMQYLRDSKDNLKSADQMAFSTPRNLFNDYSDEDEDRPETPENAIRLIPESMSAIKKSHRKERISGRFAHRVQVHSQPVKMDIGDEEERPATPPIDICSTPNYSIRSIKKSHKKDKSRRKSCGYRSEDELSDTGSLFDYSMDENAEKNKGSKETKPCVETNSTGSSPKSVEQSADQATEQTPPRNVIQSNDPHAAITPENRIDYLRRIMTDSIKKSHKKLKEINKKTHFKSRILEQQIDNMTTNESSQQRENAPDTISDDENRAGTPDEKNSSRLLLAQFTSVKKSHKKDKHRKAGFVQRHIIMSHEDESPSSSRIESRDKSPSMPFNVPQISITEASVSKSISGASLSSNNSTDSHYHSLGASPLDRNDVDLASMVSSPNKRKNSTTGEHVDQTSISSSSEGQSMEYVTAEDEFKIFTPIKKRKALVINPTPKILNAHPSASTPENSLLNGRCETPKLGLGILIPEKSVSVESPNDSVRQEATGEVENENGRSTPENKGRLERISALSSIKKSHKKDKWAKAKRRNTRSHKETFDSIQQDNNGDCSKNLYTSTCWRSSGSRESTSDNAEKTDSLEKHMEPQPSTSYSEGIINSNSPMKTPPNGLGAKTYLRLVQATSIKRSHKKMRQRRQRVMQVLNPELSDDGSLFDEAEKSASLDESAMEEKISAESDVNHEHVMPLDDPKVKETMDTEMKYPKGGGSQSFKDNRSDDGSIFGSDGEMDCPRKS